MLSKQHDFSSNNNDIIFNIQIIALFIIKVKAFFGENLVKPLTLSTNLYII